jgi:hypothetical protein
VTSVSKGNPCFPLPSLSQTLSSNFQLIIHFPFLIHIFNSYFFHLLLQSSKLVIHFSLVTSTLYIINIHQILIFYTPIWSSTKQDYQIAPFEKHKPKTKKLLSVTKPTMMILPSHGLIFSLIFISILANEATLLHVSILFSFYIFHNPFEFNSWI